MAKTQKPKAKRRMVRLLPLTVTMLSLLFIIKMNEVYIGSRQLRELYTARDAVAADKKPAEEAAKDKKTEEAASGDKKLEATAEVKKSPETATKEEAKGEHGAKEEPAKEEAKGEHGAKEEPAKEEAKGEKGAKEEAKAEHGAKEDKKPVEEKTFGAGKKTVKEIEAMKARDAQPRYTQNELDVLQNLAKRRDELDQREKEFEIKARVLDASEKRITDKISEMKTLQAELSKVLAQYNEKQDSQIKSLVKIYESMKPEEAAAIFNEMEMPILLDVIGKMSERKVALVLAGMNPKRARDVTQELADKRKKATQSAAAVGAN